MNILHDDFALIASFDLDPIKVKLMHRESGEGWTLERANAVEFEYRRFLYLMKKYPEEQAAPTVDVDTFWHYHILDTMKYARDCEAVFGYFLHHFPYVGLREDDEPFVSQQMGERMQALYEETFGEKYPLPHAADLPGKPPSAAAFCTKSTATACGTKAPATAFCTKAATTAFCTKTPAAAFCTKGANVAVEAKNLFAVRPRLAVYDVAA